MSKNRNDQKVPVACINHLKQATLELRNTSCSMFSARRRVLLSEHVSSTIRIRYDEAVQPNTNRLFGPLFGTEANTNRIFGTSLVHNTYGPRRFCSESHHSNDRPWSRSDCEWQSGTTCTASDLRRRYS